MIDPTVTSEGLYRLACGAQGDRELLTDISNHPHASAALRAWANFAQFGDAGSPPKPEHDDGEALDEEIEPVTSPAPLPVRHRPRWMIPLIVIVALSIVGACGWLWVSTMRGSSSHVADNDSVQHTASVEGADKADSGNDVTTQGESVSDTDQSVVRGAGDGFYCTAHETSVSCTGLNDQGQLGQISDLGAHENTVTTDKPVTLLAVGERHVCYSTGVGVTCWGANQWKQAADTATTVVTPSPIEQLKDKEILSLTAGDIHSCAVTDNHHVWCWGSDWTGQVTGEGVQGEKAHGPIHVGLPSAISDVTTVIATRYGTCIENDSSQACWGANNSKRIADTEDDIVGITIMTPLPSSPPLSTSTPKD